jgi:hypothetical protein
MAFADPQSITINAVAISAPRTGFNPNSGVFTSNDGNTKLTVSDTYGAKRTRRSIRLDFRKIAADPLISAQNILYTGSVYLVVDQPITGYTAAELKLQIDGFLAYLSASSGAKITQLLGGEV